VKSRDYLDRGKKEEDLTLLAEEEAERQFPGKGTEMFMTARKSQGKKNVAITNAQPNP